MFGGIGKGITSFFDELPVAVKLGRTKFAVVFFDIGDNLLVIGKGLGKSVEAVQQKSDNKQGFHKEVVAKFD